MQFLLLIILILLYFILLGVLMLASIAVGASDCDKKGYNVRMCGSDNFYAKDTFISLRNNLTSRIRKIRILSNRIVSN